MSKDIQVTVSPDRLVIEPGEEAKATAEIRNSGNVVEVFLIEVQGIDASWYTLSVSSVSLFPGDKETVNVSLALPSSSTSKAGTYTVSVKVSSKRDPSITTTANLSLDIGRISDYNLDLSPRKIRARKGSFTVVITNTGNLTNTFQLTASDPEEMCNYDFKSDTVAVEAGATARVALTVKPRKRPITGNAKMFNFTVEATPLASEVKTVDGELECPPLLPKWAVAAISAVVVVVVAVIIVLIVSGGGGQTLPIQESFELKPGDYQMYEWRLKEGTMNAEVDWTGADSLSLTLYKPGAEGVATDRQDGTTSPLEINYTIAGTDTAKGDTWSIYIANISQSGTASGTIKVSQP